MTDVDVRQCVTTALRQALDIPEGTELAPNEALERWDPDGLSAISFQLDVESALGLAHDSAPSIQDPAATTDWLVAQTVTLMAHSL
jgi:hypothetical protein